MDSGEAEPARVVAVLIEADDEQYLSFAVDAFAAAGVDVSSYRVPATGYPADLSDEQSRLHNSFTATPETLTEAWRVARWLETETHPQDVVLVSDHGGGAGVFALEQAMRDQRQRRTVVAVAGQGVALHWLDVAGTMGGLAGEAISSADWELVLYRFATTVVCLGEYSADLLSGLGVGATPLPIASGGAGPAPWAKASPLIRLPEPVSRRSRTPEMLRALAAAAPALSGAVLSISASDEPDEVWEGNTWEARGPLPDGLEAALVREHESPQPDIVLLGDSLAQPSKESRRAAEAGAHMVVRTGSAAAALWPSATSWRDEQHLAAILQGDAEAELPGPPPPTADVDPLLSPQPENVDRARRVSVAVPVYRDVRYLAECVESLLAQAQQPHEILLIDDGSHTDAVDEALAGWAEAHPVTIRVLRQENRGVCAARNTALDAMTGDAFVLVDADDMLHPEFVEACAVALRANPELSAIATWTEFFGDYEGVEAKPPFDRRVGLRENPIVSTCVLVDMAIRDNGIRFTDDMAFFFCEDWDVWSKIVAAGGSFGLVPRALARHRVHRASGGFRRTELAHAIGRARAMSHLRDMPAGLFTPR